jgi:hypothetical protein
MTYDTRSGSKEDQNKTNAIKQDRKLTRDLILAK